ncbi:hypothetical protein KIN20_018093 [Parelaphostrongylus tenuis]|uniref:Battenin n=1 Tax=Parelaphostrongylus tenuis TaxID=148309 RepID=A0AAD5QP68_PARTN|nr:hypothetical protein KIN20_018093 [Parelaphostrongylus tenuis]
MRLPKANHVAVRNMMSFWIFGMCNNFAYNVMLGAAQDILIRSSNSTVKVANTSEHCVEVITSRNCSPASAGVVLLCNILPCLMVKLLCPFFMERIPYAKADLSRFRGYVEWLAERAALTRRAKSPKCTVRHFVICITQLASLLITAWAETMPTALIGVLLASFSSGFGETTYLGLASHYSK